MSGLLLLLCADVIATVFVFGFSLTYNNSSLYDPYWSVAPPLLAFYWLWEGNDNLVGYLMLILIFLWAIRLTYNWVRSWQGLSHEDWRYKMLREENPRLYPLINFVGIHMFPTIMVFIGMLPVYVVAAHTVNSLVNIPVLAIGFVITLGAIFIELIADEQMHSFKRVAKPEEFINRGIWKYSRHPNYFGEISFWLGLWVMQMSIVPSFWWTAIGFIAMLIMFLFASIPMMEAKNRKSKTGYQEYVKKVSILIPFPYKR